MLDSLLDAVRGSRDYEILVVDNGSTDGTRQLVKTQATRDKSLRYVSEPVPGLLSGRHRGALDSSGDICVFLDDDVLLGPNWLGALADAFRDPAVGMVGGPSRPLYESNVPDWLDEFFIDDGAGRMCTWLSLIDSGSQVIPTDPRNIWGLNFSIRRRTLFEHGGFHPDNTPKQYQRFQGDGEYGLTMKVHAAAVAALYHPDAAVEHITPAARLTRDYFERRAFYQGVCDSYSNIRRVRKVIRSRPSVRERIGNIWRELRSPRRESPMKRATARAYRAGFDFHQREVDRDPALLDWVLRPDYWDYRFPGAGGQYISTAP
jgi:glycosyltransferase involved in cell wall biosynthesis